MLNVHARIVEQEAAAAEMLQKLAGMPGISSTRELKMIANKIQRKELETRELLQEGFNAFKENAQNLASNLVEAVRANATDPKQLSEKAIQGAMKQGAEAEKFTHSSG